MDTPPKQLKGFAAMTPERRREIASKGGRSAQDSGVGHRFTSDEARDAGRRGGITVSKDRAHMASIGAKGGRRSGENRADSSLGNE